MSRVNGAVKSIGGQGDFMKKMKFFLSFEFSNLGKLSVIILSIFYLTVSFSTYTGTVVPDLAS